MHPRTGADDFWAAGLYADLVALPGTEGEAYLVSDADRTGAVLMGRRSYEGADDPDSYADDYEFQVPIFVVTHQPPAVTTASNDRLSISFVTGGVRAAVARAVEAAGAATSRSSVART